MILYLHIIKKTTVKKLFTIASLLAFCAGTQAQNVGIGTTTPTERLDVNGNVNVGGQLKLAGAAGTTNQVLMKDASNNPVWGNLSSYKNIAVFNCSSSSATTAGTNNVTYNWTVPAGVTSILMEGWSGGGGGGTYSGGGGGGYMTAILAVTPGNTVTVTVGAGGAPGSSTADGIHGGTTTVQTSIGTCYIIGAGGGHSGDLSSNVILALSVSFGGGGLGTAGITNVVAYYGQSGSSDVIKFEQVTATEFAKVIYYGDGGDAALFPGSGGKGSYSLSSATYSMINLGKTGALVGGGGGGDRVSPGAGLGGMVILHY